MTDRTPAALMTSLALHALVVAIVVLFTYSASLRSKEVPKIFELVRGEGTNYMATEAPALGTPGGLKLSVPAPTPPKPESAVAPEPAPAKPEASPVTPPPPTKAPVTKAPPVQRTPAQEIRRLLANADLRAKRSVAKQRDEEQKQLTKAEFDRVNKAKAAEKSAPTKIQKVDGEGIAKGVEGGSTANKEGGANGRALTAAEGNRMERYESALMAALRRALEQEKPPGLSESLVASVQFRVEADGTLSNVHFAKGSGSAEFDNAVRAAIRRVSGSIGARPDGKSEVVELDFRAKEDGE